MAIEINRAWLTNADGTDCVPTDQIIACNTSQLADNMKHKSYNAARIVYWNSGYDANNIPTGLTDAVKNISRSALSRANEMFDHSFCWSGLGAESFLSNVKYVCYGDIITGQGTEPQVYQNHDYNTPWSFDLYLNEGANKVYQYLTFDYSTMSDSNTKANRIRCYCWKNTADENPNNPQAYWTSSSSGSGYYCTALRPIHKIAIKNWINLIIVIAKSGRGTNYTGVRAFDLYTYVNTNAHENYPYIIMVSLVPMMKTNTSGNNRVIIGYGDTSTNPRLSLTTYTQPSMSGELAYTSSASGSPKVYYPDSTWRQGMFIGGYFQGSGNAPAYGGSTNFLCNDNTNHSVYMSANIPIMGAMIGEQGDGAGNLQYRTQLKTIFEIGNDKWYEHKWNWQGTDYLCYLRDYDSDFYDECLTQAACFGMFFTDRYTVAYNGELYDENMYLGTLDDNNIGHGLYTKGLKNASQKQWDWTDSSEADYNPEYNPTPPDPNTYGTPWNYNSPNMCNTGQQYYSLTGANVEKIVGDLWAALDTKPSDISVTDFCKEKYLSNNPLDVVVSLKRFPFELPTGAQQNPENIVLGTFETSAEGYTLPLSYKWVYLGNCTLYEHFGGNFLDYDLTTAQLYIPFCGTIEIDVPFFMGDGLEIYMAVDYYTGACTAYVQRASDKMVYATVNGNCSIDLPITGIQSATLNSTLLNAKQSVIGGAVGAVGKTIAGAAAIGAATVATGGAALVGGLIGGAASVASGLLSGAQADAKNYELHHTQIPLKQIGANSGQNSWCGELRPILYLYRPIIADNYNAADYGHTIGFATCVSDTIGNYSGYTEATNIDLSGFAATDEEKTAINNLLVRGVYL